MEVAEKVGGKNHGFRFIQVPIGVMMPEALVENWQNFETSGGANLEKDGIT